MNSNTLQLRLHDTKRTAHNAGEHHGEADEHGGRDVGLKRCACILGARTRSTVNEMARKADEDEERGTHAMPPVATTKTLVPKVVVTPDSARVKGLPPDVLRTVNSFPNSPAHETIHQSARYRRAGHELEIGSAQRTSDFLEDADELVLNDRKEVPSNARRDAPLRGGERVYLAPVLRYDG